jgi:hypothetical protein
MARWLLLALLLVLPLRLLAPWLMLLEVLLLPHQLLRLAPPCVPPHATAAA